MWPGAQTADQSQSEQMASAKKGGARGRLHVIRRNIELVVEIAVICIGSCGGGGGRGFAELVALLLLDLRGGSMQPRGSARRAGRGGRGWLSGRCGGCSRAAQPGRSRISVRSLGRCRSGRSGGGGGGIPQPAGGAVVRRRCSSSRGSLGSRRRRSAGLLLRCSRSRRGAPARWPQPRRRGVRVPRCRRGRSRSRSRRGRSRVALVLGLGRVGVGRVGPRCCCH